VKTVKVPHDFPAYAVPKLKRRGIRAVPTMPPFFPGRVVKTEAEVAAVRDAAARTGRRSKRAST